MPELPEVETIARKLRRTIAGKRILDVRLSGEPLRKPVPGGFAARLRGRKIGGIHRRGKYLVMEMEPHCFWLIHLGMSGRLFYRPAAGEYFAHTHAAIRFVGGGELHYCDPRRFGLLGLYEIARISDLPEIRRLGRDPLSAEFDSRWLRMELLRSRREIKAFLLDQSKIAGVGNIYASEALFRARIHPARRCHTLTRAEAAALARATTEVLRSAIHHRGTSFSDFMDSDGERGEHQEFLRVFQREGEHCRRCRATIRRMIQSNRSTFFCPGCQRKRPSQKGKGGQSRDRGI